MSLQQEADALRIVEQLLGEAAKGSSRIVELVIRFKRAVQSVHRREEQVAEFPLETVLNLGQGVAADRGRIFVPPGIKRDLGHAIIAQSIIRGGPAKGIGQCRRRPQIVLIEKMIRQPVQSFFQVRAEEEPVAQLRLFMIGEHRRQADEVRPVVRIVGQSLAVGVGGLGVAFEPGQRFAQMFISGRVLADLIEVLPNRFDGLLVLAHEVEGAGPPEMDGEHVRVARLGLGERGQGLGPLLFLDVKRRPAEPANRVDRRDELGVVESAEGGLDLVELATLHRRVRLGEAGGGAGRVELRLEARLPYHVDGGREPRADIEVRPVINSPAGEVARHPPADLRRVTPLDPVPGQHFDVAGEPAGLDSANLKPRPGSDGIPLGQRGGRGDRKKVHLPETPGRPIPDDAVPIQLRHQSVPVDVFLDGLWVPCLDGLVEPVEHRDQLTDVLRRDRSAVQGRLRERTLRTNDPFDPRLIRPRTEIQAHSDGDRH